MQKRSDVPADHALTLVPVKGTEGTKPDNKHAKFKLANPFNPVFVNNNLFLPIALVRMELAQCCGHSTQN